MRNPAFIALLACVVTAGCSSLSNRGAAGSDATPKHNLSIVPDRPANLYFCLPGKPQWQYVGAADPAAGRKATTGNGAALAPTLDFDVVANHVIYLRMDLGDTLGEPAPASATGSRHAVALRLNAGHHYRLDWQAGKDPRKPKAQLTDLASRVVTEGVGVPVLSCR